MTIRLLLVVFVLAASASASAARLQPRDAKVMAALNQVNLGELRPEQRQRCSRMTGEGRKVFLPFGSRCARLNEVKGLLPNGAPVVDIIGAGGEALPNVRADGNGYQISWLAKTQKVADPAIALFGIASDPDNDLFRMMWSVTAGKIVGDGPRVMWDLTGVSAGSYLVSVEVDDGCGCVASDTRTLTVLAARKP